MKDPNGSGTVQFRSMRPEDLPEVHKLSLATLWPHRLEDWKFILEIGEGIVAEDGTGIIGTVMYWLHGTDYAWLGMTIVSPDHRHQGLGRELVSRALNATGDRTVLLHTTSDGVPLFESFGFRQTCWVHRHQGSVFHYPFVPLSAGERIRPISPRDEAALADMASRSSGMPRAPLIKHLLTVADVVAIDRYGDLIAFAALRKFGHGFVIGPVIAPDIDRAKALIAHWAGSRAGSFVRADVPDSSGLSSWLTDMGLVQVDETVQAMVRGKPPLPDASITRFALLSQSLG
ncbi:MULTISPECIES: GNAT family N-acetyltransferase [unclassified Cupriavidus]|uniref:GNAT family N-acetyltransferase n=1 Tax=Cupriavidus TaxID=106589 RepID=UPI00048EC214|nr:MULTISPECIES: GNAT family N-acetyltransferase [unclassified Cupriavidus]MDK2662068.1 GNAT family N-acetyltransferase [Cupriavidus sp. LEh21]